MRFVDEPSMAMVILMPAVTIAMCVFRGIVTGDWAAFWIGVGFWGLLYGSCCLVAFSDVRKAEREKSRLDALDFKKIMEEKGYHFPKEKEASDEA